MTLPYTGSILNTTSRLTRSIEPVTSQHPGPGTHTSPTKRLARHRMWASRPTPSPAASSRLTRTLSTPSTNAIHGSL
jgi:hypothetical protein